MAEQNKKKLGLAILLAVFVFSLVAAIIGSLFYYQKAYANRIYENVYFGPLELSGLSKKQAAYIIQKDLDQLLEREITLKAGDKEIKIKPADSGVSFNTANIVTSSYQIGRDGATVNNLIKSAQTLIKKETVTTTPSINQDHYESFINLTIPELNIEARDATLKLDKGQIIEDSGQIGQEVITTGLPEVMLRLVVNPHQTILTLNTKKIEPDTQATDYGSAKKYAESVINKNVGLSYQSFVFNPDAEALGKWLDFSNANGHITASLNDDNIKEYLTAIASKFEVQRVDRKVNALDGSVLVEGKAGIYLDKDKAISDIKSAMGQDGAVSVGLTTRTEEPAELKVVPDEGLVPGRFEGKYIDVDLAQQKLCLINGNNIENCFVVSTGKASTPTPLGTRVIDSKIPREWSGSFGLWMPWWQSLGAGYGIHELPEWPSGYKEGENHLGTPVSHGCIRLGVGPAEQVYNWTDIGTPVYIHK